MLQRVIRNTYQVSIAAILFSLFILKACKSSKELQIYNPDVELNVVSGFVKKASTGDPLSKVRIHVRETSIISVSDSIGHFNLYHIPKGRYQVLFSAAGIKDTLVAFDLTGDPEKPLTVYLEEISKFRRTGNGRFSTPPPEHDRLARLITEKKYQKKNLENDIYRLSQSLIDIVDADENETDKCRRLLSKYFIGSNRYPGCELINSEAVTFEQCEESSETLKVQTPVTLKVLNRYLGYYLTVNIDYLSLKKDQLGYKINYRGNTYFSEIFGDITNNKEVLNRRRNEIFNGSLKHFLIAASRLKPIYYYGFELYSGHYLEEPTSLGSSYSKVNDVEININDIVRSTEHPEIKQLLFDGEVRVVYKSKWVKNKGEYAGIEKGRFPRSWLRLISPPVLFTSSGILLDENGIQISGYWNSQNVCEMLPEDYIPDF